MRKHTVLVFGAVLLFSAIFIARFEKKMTVAGVDPAHENVSMEEPAMVMPASPTAQTTASANLLTPREMVSPPARNPNFQSAESRLTEVELTAAESHLLNSLVTTHPKLGQAYLNLFRLAQESIDMTEEEYAALDKQYIAKFQADPQATKAILAATLESGMESAGGEKVRKLSYGLASRLGIADRNILQSAKQEIENAGQLPGAATRDERRLAEVALSVFTSAQADPKARIMSAELLPTTESLENRQPDLHRRLKLMLEVRPKKIRVK